MKLIIPILFFIIQLNSCESAKLANPKVWVSEVLKSGFVLVEQVETDEWNTCVYSGKDKKIWILVQPKQPMQCSKTLVYDFDVTDQEGNDIEDRNKKHLDLERKFQHGKDKSFGCYIFINKEHNGPANLKVTVNVDNIHSHEIFNKVLFDE